MSRLKLTVTVLFSLLVTVAWADKPMRPSGHEQIPEWATNAINSIEYGLLLEVEASAGKIAGDNESDIILATAAFDLEASFNAWLRGHVGILWEQYDKEDDNLDEAYIAMGATDEIPFYLIAGKFYLPFGNFQSAFVSDPMTLELAEINKSSAMAGYGLEWIDLHVGAFRGDIKEGDEDGDSRVEDVYASVTFMPHENIEFGAYWLSDLMETDSQSELELGTAPGYEKQGGAGAYANLGIGDFSLNAEFVSALGDYEIAGNEYKPSAYNLEASVVIAEDWTAGIKFEGSEDVYSGYDRNVLELGDQFPEKAYGAVVAWNFHEHATVALEYLHLEDLEDGEDGDLVTAQLSLEI